LSTATTSDSANSLAAVNAAAADDDDDVVVMMMLACWEFSQSCHAVNEHLQQMTDDRRAAVAKHVISL